MRMVLRIWLSKQTLSMHEIFDFYEDLFTINYQHPSYKQVYLNNILVGFFVLLWLNHTQVRFYLIEIKQKEKADQKLLQEFFGKIMI
jgi:hypothetical protein